MINKGAYEDETYCIKVDDGCDALSVQKSSGSDWCHIKMVTNERDNGEIVIRSKDMIEQLWFMLSQMLGKNS